MHLSLGGRSQIAQCSGSAVRNRRSVMKILIVGAGAMGKLRGIATPLHEAITELIHLLEKWGAGREI